MSKVTLYRRRNAKGKKAFYYVKWVDQHGRQRRKSLEVVDRDTAKRLRDELQRQMTMDRHGLAEEADFTPDDAWAAYKSVVHRSEHHLKHEKCYWDNFFDMTEAPTLRAIRRSDVAEWQKTLTTREDKPNKPVSVNTKTRTIAAIISTLIREEIYDGPNPFAGRKALDEGTRKIRVIPWTKVHEILTEALQDSVDLYMVVVLGGLLGLRKGEILRARWEHIDWKREEFRVQGTKTEASADSIHLHKSLREHLEPYKKDTGYLVKPGKKPGVHLYRWEFKQRWAALRKKCGVPSARLHDLRHSFATHLLDLGYPMKDIAMMLRHTSTQMTQRYADIRTLKVKLGDIDGAE